MLGLLNERQYVAHTEDAAGHAVGVEGLDHVQLLARADELDGLAGGRSNGEGRTAAGVAVQLGEHHARDAQRLVKGGGGVHRVLTGHRVHHQQDLRRLHRVADALQLLHQGLIDVQATGRVQKDQVVAVLFGVLDGGFGDVHRIGLSHLKDGNVQLLAHGLQLLDGSGTVDVAGDQQRAFALLAHETGEFGAVGGFARALQAHQHHHARGLGGDVQLLVLAAHELCQLFVDDLDDHLGGVECLQHIAADSPLGHRLGEVLDHLVADVRFQQRHTHLAHGLLHVPGAQAALAAQALEGRIQFIG